MNNINESIGYYLDLKKTDYAVQINGPWGIGKTHYVWNELEPYIENKIAIHVEDDTENKKKKKDKNYKLRYVSLNGINKIDEIGERVLLADSNIFGMGYSITKSFLNATTGFSRPFKALNDELQKQFENNGYKFLNKKTMVLCFDDLERIGKSLNIQEVIGYINTNFVERNNIKTIIISNEEKLKDNTEFLKIKEKVIGRTLTFNKPIIDTIESFVESIYETEYLQYLKGNLNFIKESIKLAKINNLRTVRFVFDNFKIVFEHLTDSFLEKNDLVTKKEELIRSLFVFTLLVSNEYKLGHVGSLEDIEELDFDTYILLFNTFKHKQTIQKDEKESKAYAIEFAQRYFAGESLVLKNNYKFFLSIGLLTVGGLLDQEMFKRDVLRISPSVDKSEDILKSLNNYSYMELPELREAVEDVIENIEAANYSPMRLPAIYETLDEFNNNGYIEYDMDSILNKMKSILKQSFDKFGDFYSDDRRFQRNFNDNNSNINYQKLIKLIKDERERLIEENDLEEIKTFLSSLGSKNFMENFKNVKDKNHVFLVINKTKFSQSVIESSNAAILDFVSFLNENYIRISNVKDSYSHEVYELRKFSSDLRDNLNIHPPIDKLKRDNLEELCKKIDEVILNIDTK